MLIFSFIILLYFSTPGWLNGSTSNKYAENGLFYELHVFQHGPHGYSLANDVTADGSSQVINAAFS